MEYGELRASDVVNAACDALVAGLDSPGLPALAACPRAEADYDVHDLLSAALDGLGLTSCPAAGEAGQEAAARARTCRVLADELTPAEFAFRIHQRYGQDDGQRRSPPPRCQEPPSAGGPGAEVHVREEACTARLPGGTAGAG